MQEYGEEQPESITENGMKAWHMEVTSISWSDEEDKAFICRESFKLNADIVDDSINSDTLTQLAKRIGDKIIVDE